MMEDHRKTLKLIIETIEKFYEDNLGIDADDCLALIKAYAKKSVEEKGMNRRNETSK